jgi:hypothetical protein
MTRTAVLFASLCLVTHPAIAQETLLGADSDIRFTWGQDLRSMSIQDEMSTSLGFFMGASINRAIFVGATIGANVTHETVNHGYFGLKAQYNLMTDQAVHYGASLFAGMGNTKDYPQEKTSLFDNFGNTTGPTFTLIEPGAHVELNVSDVVRIFAGLSYRMASGLNEDDPLIATSGVTNDDLAGLSFNIGVKWGAY